MISVYCNKKVFPTVPVLLVAFNRPETTQKVFNAIAQIRPRKLYIAVDAPREGNTNDIVMREKVLQIVSNPSWECEVFLKEPPHNLGVDVSESSAITWFFEYEEAGIILEDDCLPDETFFKFCAELLEKYKDDEKIMCITGDNFQNGKKRGDASYYFSVHTHIWGWATWRCAWKHWNKDFDTQFEQFKHENGIEKITQDKHTQTYWLNIFEGIKKGTITNWDYMWTASCWFRGGLTITPNVNLVSNIGYGKGAVHTLNAESRLADIPRKMIHFPLRHPSSTVVHTDADEYVNHFVFQTHRVWKRMVKIVLEKYGLFPTMHRWWAGIAISNNRIQKYKE